MIVRLLMFSGGYDSTACLIKLLTETKEDVWVHHVVLKNEERRYEIETETVKNIVEYCREKYRPFKFSTSEFSYYDRDFGGWDVLTMGYISTITATSIQNKVFKSFAEFPEVEVIFGITKTDQLFLIDRKRKMEGMFEACFIGYNDLGIPKPFISYIIDDMIKRDVINYIPEDLRKLVWTCRRPQRVGKTYIPCGNCQACIDYRRGIENAG